MGLILKIGLTKEHHAVLNDGINHPVEHYDQFRELYVTDEVAQRQIDTYDPHSDFTAKAIQLVRAYKYKDSNINKIRNLNEWFHKNYPGFVIVNNS